jgi:ATP adenylyltransferase
MEYIYKGKEEGCFICKAASQKPSSKNLVLKKFNKVLIIMNRFPYNTGHLMIAPIAHKGDIEILTEEEKEELMEALVESVKVLKKTMKPEGFNVGINLGRIAGAGLDQHLHIHIVPRWGGDTNYMPVLSETKVIPQHIKATYRLLRKAFEKL